MKPDKKIILLNIILVLIVCITGLMIGNSGEVEDVLNDSSSETLLHVKFLDVGDADCTFIKLPNGETALIDTGDGTDVDSIINSIEDEITNYNDSGKKVIDYIILTHAHSDHIGGLRELLNTFDAGKVFIPDVAVMKDWFSYVEETDENYETLEMMKYDYEVYTNMVESLAENNVQVFNTVYGEYIDSNNILQFVQADKNFGPIGSDELSGEYWGLNENSSIVYLEYGKLTALFTGDISWNAEADFYENNLLKGKKIDVLKVPHHGLQTSSTGSFINYTNPEYGVVSRSYESVTDTFAIIRLKDANVKILETSTSCGVDLYASKSAWSIYE